MKVLQRIKGTELYNIFIKWERVVVDKFGEHGLYLYVHREMLSNTKDAHLRRKSSRASVFVIYCVARFNLAITFTSVQTLPVLVYDGQEDNGRRTDEMILNCT